MSYSEAMLTNWSFASIVNKHGNVTSVRSDVIQAVMREKLPDMLVNLTASLVDSNHSDAYPILGYSYMLIRQTMADCDTAVELYRYIDWLLQDGFAGEIASELGMAQVIEELKHRVHFRVLSRMRCGDEQHWVRRLVQEQIEDENTVLTWRVPLLIGAPLVALLICVMVGYIIYQQWRLRYDVLVGYIIYQRWKFRYDVMVGYICNSNGG